MEGVEREKGGRIRGEKVREWLKGGSKGGKNEGEGQENGGRM